MENNHDHEKRVEWRFPSNPRQNKYSSFDEPNWHRTNISCISDGSGLWSSNERTQSTTVDCVLHFSSKPDGSGYQLVGWSVWEKEPGAKTQHTLRISSIVEAFSVCVLIEKMVWRWWMRWAGRRGYIASEWRAARHDVKSFFSEPFFCFLILIRRLSGWGRQDNRGYRHFRTCLKVIYIYIFWKPVKNWAWQNVWILLAVVHLAIIKQFPEEAALFVERSATQQNSSNQLLDLDWLKFEKKKMFVVSVRKESKNYIT